MDGFEGKVAVVTGAASGIGLGLARRFVAEGMNLVMADVNASTLTAAAQEFADVGERVLTVTTDVGDSAAVDALAAATLERFGAVHVVCNNAGIGGCYGPIWRMTTEDWAANINVNLWGVIHGIRAFVPHFIAQGEGHVVNTASMAGIGTLSGIAPYVATKHAVVAISETLVVDLAVANVAGVGVSVLCPGGVNTNVWMSVSNVDGNTVSADAMRASLAQGMDTADVADLVYNAIREPRFYVFTHPDQATAWAEKRFDAITGGGTQAPPPSWVNP